MSFLLSVVAGQGGIKVPGAPGTLSLSAGTNAFDEIDLSWSAPSDTGGGTISGYRIKRDGSIIVADTSSTGTTYTASGLAVGTSYTFNVAAINEKGTGADGNTPSLSTKANMSVTVTGSPTESIHSSYKSFKFTGSGSFQITANPSSDTIDIVAVAGGGGSQGANAGGPFSPESNGGGGGGGFRTSSGVTGAIDTWTVTIGAGAAANANGGTTAAELSSGAFDVDGGRGSMYSGVQCATANGGGSAGGSAYTWPAYGFYGSASGCAGGAYGAASGNAYNNGTNGSTNQTSGGGGGGSSGAGTNAASLAAGVGGAGTANIWFDGTTDYYGGGGGGGVAVLNTSLPTGGTGGSGGGGDGVIFYRPGGVNTTPRFPTAGAANTGGGGGGGGTNSGGVIGGSGVVIIRIPWGT